VRADGLDYVAFILIWVLSLIALYQARTFAKNFIKKGMKRNDWTGYPHGYPPILFYTSNVMVYHDVGHSVQIWTAQMEGEIHDICVFQCGGCGESVFEVW